MTPQEIAAKLAEPFDMEEIRWKPAIVKGDRAMALAYVTSRAIMDRLDEVVGLDCWQDEYAFMPDGSVTCKLSLKIDGQWLTKMDIGGQSEQPDDHDKHKAAVSDALKRAAVKWGLGRFLYRLPQQWCDYDPQKKQFKVMPKLPDWVFPPKKKEIEQPKRLSADEQSTFDRWVKTIENEVTTVDECNAVRRQIADEQIPGRALQKMLWDFLCDHAKNQGWHWSPKVTKFVLGNSVKESA